MTKVTEAKKAVVDELIRSVREGDGWIVEADEKLNDANRRLIEALAAAHGGCWLGKINLYGDERHGGHPIMWQWDGSSVQSFEAALVAPSFDAELVGLIRERDDAPYEGTQRDAERVEHIQRRLSQIGGTYLVWS